WLTEQGVPDAAIRYPSAADLARLGAIRLATGQTTDPAEAIPVYVRDRVAKWLIFCRLKYSGQRIVSGIFVISIY
ncbi:MAG: hypothetical protein EBX16_02655, partial [Burkholderiaceae bacterium]|nr:hypothetical protein [Burkholderiaceae bacterium]